MTTTERLFEKIQKTNAKGKGVILSPGYGAGWLSAAKTLQSEGKVVIRDDGMWVADGTLQSVPVAEPAVEPVAESVAEPVEDVEEERPVKIPTPMITDRAVVVRKSRAVVAPPDKELEAILAHEMHPTFKSYREYVAQCLDASQQVPTISQFTGSLEAFKIAEEAEVANV